MQPISSMTTAAMVQEYNSLTGKSISKFSSRAAGEKQLEKARFAAPLVSPQGPEMSSVVVCPKCGHKRHSPHPNDPRTADCAACGTRFWLRDGKVYQHHASAPARSQSIRSSWSDPVVAAKRAQRTGVEVLQKTTDPSTNKHITVNSGKFRSVSAAFRALGLPVSRHIKFRLQLKEKKQLVFFYNSVNYHFTVV